MGTGPLLPHNRRLATFEHITPKYIDFPSNRGYGGICSGSAWFIYNFNYVYWVLATPQIQFLTHFEKFTPVRRPMPGRKQKVAEHRQGEFGYPVISLRWPATNFTHFTQVTSVKTRVIRLRVNIRSFSDQCHCCKNNKAFLQSAKW